MRRRGHPREGSRGKNINVHLKPQKITLTYKSHREVIVEEVALLDRCLLVRVGRVDLHLVLGFVVNPGGKGRRLFYQVVLKWAFRPKLMNQTFAAGILSGLRTGLTAYSDTCYSDSLVTVSFDNIQRIDLIMKGLCLE